MKVKSYPGGAAPRKEMQKGGHTIPDRGRNESNCKYKELPGGGGMGADWGTNMSRAELPLRSRQDTHRQICKKRQASCLKADIAAHTGRNMFKRWAFPEGTQLSHLKSPPLHLSPRLKCLLAMQLSASVSARVRAPSGNSIAAFPCNCRPAVSGPLQWPLAAGWFRIGAEVR